MNTLGNNIVIKQPANAEDGAYLKIKNNTSHYAFYTTMAIFIESDSLSELREYSLAIKGALSGK